MYAYSKHWLRGYAPSLNIDSVEAEINILVSTLAPVLLLALDATVLAGTLALVICVASLRSVRRLRATENWQATCHLAFDLAM